jgi:hypothetical protein
MSECWKNVIDCPAEWDYNAYSVYAVLSTWLCSHNCGSCLKFSGYDCNRLEGVGNCDVSRRVRGSLNWNQHSYHFSRP